MTVRAALGTVAVYLAAQLLGAPPDMLLAIVVLGMAASAFFMQRALVQLRSEVVVLRSSLQRLERGESLDASEPPRKRRAWLASWTVLSALLMVAAYFFARYHGAPGSVTNAIALLGGAAIFVFLRAAVIEFWDED